MFKENQQSESNPEKINKKNPENQEQEINPELLAEQKISQMEIDFSGLETNGTEGIEKANNSINLELQDVEKIKSKTGIEEKNVGILNKAGELLKNSKSAMKKLIAGGMATMAFSGGGDIKTASAEETFSKESIGVSDTIKKSGEENENVYYSGLPDKEFLKASEKIKKEFEEIGRKQFEEAKIKLLKHISSQDYLDKLLNIRALFTIL